jgi:hypothetical protein
MTGGHEAREADRRRAEAARQGNLLVYAVVRPLMFIGWALVFWGTAIGLASLWVLVTRGPAAALASLVPRTPLDLVNAGLAALAVVVWIVVVVLAAGRRHGGSHPPPDA